MTWVQVIWWVVSTLVSIALAPKPPSPKPAALEDFDIPVAEEDRPIPVIFGEVEVTGANVLWYGDLDIKKIKKSSLFGSSTVGFKYFLGLHFGLCHGPVDAVTNIRIGEKQAWSGNITGNSSGSINAPLLFGGEKREGGVEGEFDVAMGADDQLANAYLESQLGDIPAWRGVLGLIWKGGYIGNSAYPKPWAITVRRILAGWNNDTVWYSEKAVIGTRGMNPIHVIYQCMTDPEWGMGEPTSSMNEDSWRAAADTAFDENFGVRFNWNNQESIDNFVTMVLNHIYGSVGFDHVLNQYVITLYRADYDPDDLDVFDESDIKEVTSFQRQLWGETVNELTLSYTNPVSLKETSITVHDLANNLSQGARVAEKISLSGIHDNSLASLVAKRELASRSTPLAKITFVINRRFWNKLQGEVIKISWVRYSLVETVFRILTIDDGTLTSGYLTVTAIEDIFGMPNSSYLVQQPDPEDPVVPPTPDDTEGPASVISVLAAAPGSPADGDSYLVAVGASGDWAGHDNEVAEWNADEGAWEFSEPSEGFQLWINDDDVTLVFNGSTWTTIGETVVEGFGELDPRIGIRLIEHFEAFTGSFVGGRWVTSTLGTGADVAGIVEAGHPGILRLRTGTTATGLARAADLAGIADTAETGFIPGGGEITLDAVYRFSTALPSSSQLGYPRVGLMTDISGVPDQGIYFSAADDSGTFKIVGVCRTVIGGSVTTPLADGVVPTLGTWGHWRFVINAAGTQVEFFLDGVSLGSITTNIPTVAMVRGLQYDKDSGTTSLDLDIDLMVLRQIFSTPLWSD